MNRSRDAASAPVFVALGRRRVARRAAAGTLWPSGGGDRAVGNLRSALWRLRSAGIDMLEVDRQWPGAPARGRLRQRFPHGVEALSRLAARRPPLDEATEAAETAVVHDPLRESAQRVLIEAHLARGDAAEGRRVYERSGRAACDELGVTPSPALTALLIRPPTSCQVCLDALEERDHRGDSCPGVGGVPGSVLLAFRHVPRHEDRDQETLTLPLDAQEADGGLRTLTRVPSLPSDVSPHRHRRRDPHVDRAHAAG